jgi:hypothetical protein
MARAAVFAIAIVALAGACRAPTIMTTCCHVLELRQYTPALGVFTTEDSANTYPALPVREGEHVVVVFADHPVAVADIAIARPTQTLRLAPTARSLLR